MICSKSGLQGFPGNHILQYGDPFSLLCNQQSYYQACPATDLPEYAFIGRSNVGNLR